MVSCSPSKAPSDKCIYHPPWSIFSPGFLPFEALECAGVSEPISLRAWPHLPQFPGGSVNLPAMQETWIPSLGQEDPLGKGKADHSSILAWRIPWTEEPGGLSSSGLQGDLT